MNTDMQRSYGLVRANTGKLHLYDLEKYPGLDSDHKYPIMPICGNIMFGVVLPTTIYLSDQLSDEINPNTCGNCLLRHAAYIMHDRY